MEFYKLKITRVAKLLKNLLQGCSPAYSAGYQAGGLSANRRKTKSIFFSIELYNNLCKNFKDFYYSNHCKV